MQRPTLRQTFIGSALAVFAASNGMAMIDTLNEAPAYFPDGGRAEQASAAQKTWGVLASTVSGATIVSNDVRINPGRSCPHLSPTVSLTKAIEHHAGEKAARGFGVAQELVGLPGYAATGAFVGFVRGVVEAAGGPVNAGACPDRTPRL